MSFEFSGFLPHQIFLLASRISEESASCLKLTISLREFHVLSHIAEYGSLSVRDIQAQIGMEKSRASRTIARLQAMGLIEKRAHPTDGRLVDIVISGQGLFLIEDAVPMAESYQSELMSRLGDDAVKTLEALGRLLPSQ